MYKKKMNHNSRLFWVMIFTSLIQYNAFAENYQTIVPDSEIQKQIHKTIYAADNKEEFNKQLEKLRQMCGGKEYYIKLVPQVIYYSSRGKEIREAMARDIIISNLYTNNQLNKEQIIVATVPYLDTKDPKLRKDLHELLNSMEDRSSSRPPNYSYYQSYIQVNKLNPPEALIEYIYQSSPGTALLTLMRIYMHDPKGIKEILWAEHIISDVLWQQQHGFLKSDEVKPAVMEQLDKLSQHEAWWVRLYVAEILKQEPEFKTEEIIKRLKADKHFLVRKVFFSP